MDFDTFYACKHSTNLYVLFEDFHTNSNHSSELTISTHLLCTIHNAQKKSESEMRTSEDVQNVARRPGTVPCISHHLAIRWASASVLYRSSFLARQGGFRA